ncbi:MAG: methylated-DNA--[protein]-cysteine S-methyltransferase [Micrococcales bacterium]|nr:methylated-DNA--[protein]-cysteine S-methyltransferase [Micrococcales bacterium]
MPSPVGGLGLVEADGALVAIHFDAAPVPEDRAPAPSPLLEEVRTQLEQYFRGERRVFDLPVRPRGTAFRQRVWEVLATVPWGTTTYGAIADRLGLPPGASRAVGAANGANPVPIVLPCHRVVGADGTLTGYAGGLERKAALLRLEGVPTEADQAVLF